MVGLAPVLYHGQPVAFDLFDRLHGILGAPINAAYPALYRNYNGHSEADTQKKAASLKTIIKYFFGHKIRHKVLENRVFKRIFLYVNIQNGEKCI